MTRDLEAELKAALEAHEADKQAFSDAVEKIYNGSEPHIAWLKRFIIKKPDPLDDLVQSVASELGMSGASTLHTLRSDDFKAMLRKALSGLKIVEASNAPL